jgi:REP element-mobilizing transposase RayT
MPDPKPNPLLDGLHFRGRLPHLKTAGATYFVTFRLADSLPAGVVAKLKEQRAAILHNALAAGRPLTWREERELFAWYSEKVEAVLDTGSGFCWLSRPEPAELVSRALCFFDGARYELGAWVVMPNHVHAVVWPASEFTLSSILHSWKSYTATQANRLVGRVGKAFWQTESYDHWIRNDEELARVSAYVENNPVKAGFCTRPEEWRWSSASAAAAEFRKR